MKKQKPIYVGIEMETADEMNCYRIQVVVRNPLLGPIFSYKGTFVERDQNK
ncbi:DUF4166 domain-containing protein [Bacillus gaemokensis]|uniref:DUF4166 domain-containing protein n=1 Tax=Bacillus gaemokensis TaxID=574375 RepID=UPI000A7AC7C5